MKRSHSLSKNRTDSIQFISSSNFNATQMRNLHGYVFFGKTWFVLKTYLYAMPYINSIKVFIHVIATHFKGIWSHLNIYVSPLSFLLMCPVKESKTDSIKNCHKIFQWKYPIQHLETFHPHKNWWLMGSRSSE